MKRKTRDIPAQTRSTTRTRRESNEGINFVDFLDNIIKFLCYYNIRQKNIHYIFENLYLKYVIQDRQDGNHVTISKFQKFKVIKVVVTKSEFQKFKMKVKVKKMKMKI